MGAAWCRDRAAQAKDSKSPIDRVIVKCVNQMALSERPITNNVIQGPAKYPRLHLTAASRAQPDPVRPNTASEWQDVDLKVPDQPEERTVGKAPIPPPRKKRMVTAGKQDQGKVEETPKKKSVPEAPVIYLEVDTPVSKHRKKSAPVLYRGPDSPEQKKKVDQVESEVEGLGLSRRSTSSMALRSGNVLDSEIDMLKLPRRSTSSMSLRSASPVPEATAERLDNYMKSCRSFGSLRPEEMIDEINQALSDSSSNDSWAGLDDWDLGIVDHYGTRGMSPPVTPTSQLPPKSPTRGHGKAEFTLGEPRKKKKRTKTKDSAERKLKKVESKEKKSSDSKDFNDSGRNRHGDVMSPPANFQADAKSYNKGGTTLIKPSQISVQDFLRRSNGNDDAKAREFGKLTISPPELRVNVPTDSAGFSFDFSKGLMPSRSPQIEIPGTPSTPRGLSRCSSPLPSMFMNNIQTTTPPSSPTNEDNLSSWTSAEKDTTTNLMRILQEYHLTADVIGDKDAKKILQELGIPENLIDEIPELHKPSDKTLAPEENGSSGLSSMTPSLTELEASLSELLEASAANGDDDEIEEEMRSQAPQAVPTLITQEDSHFKPISMEKSTTSHTEETNTIERETRVTTASSQEVAVTKTTKTEETKHVEMKSQKESKLEEGKQSNLVTLFNVV